MRKKTINVKPENYSFVEVFLDESYDYLGHSGGLTITEKLYSGGISFICRENHFSKNSPIKYQIKIDNPENFNKESLDKLTKIATQKFEKNLKERI